MKRAKPTLLLILAFICAGGFTTWTDEQLRVTVELIRTLSGHTALVCSVTFSPDGRLLASGSWDETIKLWEVATGRAIRTLSGHTDYVHSVAFSPDGKLLASGSYGKTITLWDVATGNTVRTLFSHAAEVYSVTFSPDGKLLASSSADHTIKLWEVRLEETWSPQASFVFSPAQPRVGQAVRFDASASSDPDGTITDYAWDFGDGMSSAKCDPVHQYKKEGTYTIRLTVMDNDGLTGVTTKTLLIAPEPSHLIAAFTSRVVDESLHKFLFDASSSSSAMGKIIRYEWDWDSDGSYDTAVEVPEIMNRFSKEGPYKVTLTIVDDQGNRASCTKVVTSKPAE